MSDGVQEHLRHPVRTVYDDGGDRFECFERAEFRPQFSAFKRSPFKWCSFKRGAIERGAIERGELRPQLGRIERGPLERGSFKWSTEFCTQFMYVRRNIRTLFTRSTPQS